jgi:D-alanyl-lipoteichoic acid acyltransferase DltB (MBOAT superfamily)
MLVAAGLAVARMRRHPKVSLITLAGVAIYFFRLIFFPLIFYYVPDIGQSLHFNSSQVDWWYTAINVLDDAFLAFVAVLFVVAAFTGRPQVSDNKTFQGAN